MKFRVIFRSALAAGLLATGLAACAGNGAVRQCITQNEVYEEGVNARHFLEGLGMVPARPCEDEVLPPRAPLVIPPTFDLPPPQPAAT